VAACEVERNHIGYLGPGLSGPCLVPGFRPGSLAGSLPVPPIKDPAVVMKHDRKPESVGSYVIAERREVIPLHQGEGISYLVKFVHLAVDIICQLV